MRIKTAGAMVAAAALGCCMSGCGAGGAAGPTKTGAAAPTGAVLTDAYSATLSAKSADVTITGGGQADGQTVSYSGHGAIDWATNEGSLALDVAAAGQHVTLDEVIASAAVYVKLPPEALQGANAATPWIAVSRPGVSANSGVDPRQLLSVLEASSNGVTRVGSSTVDGEATTEYSASVNPSLAAATLPAADRAAASKGLAALGSSTIPVKVWIDGQGQLVRLDESFSLQLPASSASGSQGPQSLALALQMDLTHYGVPVSVTPPPADQVRQLPGATAGPSVSTQASGAS